MARPPSSAVHDPGRALLRELAGIVGSPHCLTDPDVLVGYTTDWTGRYRGSALAVVRPGSTAEVAASLAVAARHGAAVIPQGGNTGLVGGSVPRPDGDAAGTNGRPQVVLSLRRLDEIGVVDASSRLLDAGAGTTLGRAQHAAAAAGCRLGIDLAARDSATLGGMVATNAGGLTVLRFGAMRARLAGVEAVLADGTVLSRLSGLVKDNVGWDTASLFAGSEGTLGVVTRVMVRLEPEVATRVTALAAFADLGAALRVVTGPLVALRSLEAVELTFADGMRLVCDQTGLPLPVGASEHAAVWLTIEAAADGDPTDELAAALDDRALIGVAVASDTAGRERLWAYRERHTEAVGRLGVAHKLDIAVRPGRMADLVEALPGRLAAVAPDARVVMWGHVADGNLHVNVVGPPAADDRADDAVLRLALELGGSISAEHGVGIARRRWLPLARSAAELEVLDRVKRALDPGRLLNPGVLEPLPPTWS